MAAASVKSRISWNPIDPGLFKDDNDDVLASFENISDAADRVDQLRLERIVYFRA